MNMNMRGSDKVIKKLTKQKSLFRLDFFILTKKTNLFGFLFYERDFLT